MLVESETSSETSNSAHLDNQTSGVFFPASTQEEQEILKDFLAANIDSDDDFGDTGVCANCITVNQKKVLNSSGAPAVTSQDLYCSTDCQRKDWGFHKFACSVVVKRAPEA